METPQTEALTLHQCEAGGGDYSWLMLNQCGTKLGFLAREVKGKDRAESHGVEGKPCFQVIVFLEGLQESSLQEANGWKNERLWESLVQETQEANNQKNAPRDQPASRGMDSITWWFFTPYHLQVPWCRIPQTGLVVQRALQGLLVVCTHPQALGSLLWEQLLSHSFHIFHVLLVTLDGMCQALCQRSGVFQGCDTSLLPSGGLWSM